MATFQVEMEIAGREGDNWQQLDATVGTKAAFAWAPQPVLEALGIQPEKRVSLRHLDGRLIKRDVAQARIRVAGREVTATIVFGAARDAALVGSETLEQLGLQATAQNQLVPAGGAVEAR
jgi:predicted aspartyl protease